MKWCQLHPGQSYGACRHCTRAAALTAAALADVIPLPPRTTRAPELTPEQVEHVRALRATGLTRAAVAHETGISVTTVSNIASGTAYNPRIRSKVSVTGGSSASATKARRQYHAERSTFAGYGTGSR